MTTIVTLANGVRVFNTSAHGYIMEDGTEVPGNPDVSKVLVSKFEEQVIASANGVEFVQSVPVPTAEGVAWLAQFKAENPGVLVVTSFANLTAYADTSLVGFIATEETARVKDLADKRMRLDKMAVVPANQVQIPRDVIEGALKSLGQDLVYNSKVYAWAQEPWLMDQSIANGGAWGDYVRSINALLEGSGMTQRDFLALLLDGRTPGGLPPVGSREEDHQLGIRWSWHQDNIVNVFVADEFPLRATNGFYRDGSTPGQALEIDTLDNPGGTAERTVRAIANLRGEPVWVIWPNVSNEPVAIQPQA